jgi:hypothetical protein
MRASRRARSAQMPWYMRLKVDGYSIRVFTPL